MSINKSKLLFILVFSYIFVLGCLTLNSINQPSEVMRRQDFQAIVNFTATNSNVCFAAILVPTGFEVNSLTWDGRSLTRNSFVENLLSEYYLPDAGYFWWVGVGEGNAGTFDAVVAMTAGNTVGDYLIDYRVGHYDELNQELNFTDSLLNNPLSVVPSSDGWVYWLKDTFGATESAGIGLTDADLSGSGSVAVSVWSGTDPDPLQVLLSEDPADSGIFLGEVQLGVDIAVVAGDTVTVEYIDANDGSGGENVLNYAYAGVIEECTPGSGPCCGDDSLFRDSTYICSEDISSVYECRDGTGCGSDVYVSGLDRYCSGASAVCDGDTAWDDWSVFEDCSIMEVCSPGSMFCQASTTDEDNDGLSVCEEAYYGSSDTDPDSDDDLMPDGYEVDNTLNPIVADSETADLDLDTIYNVHEYFNQTRADTPDPVCGAGGHCVGDSGGQGTADGDILGNDLSQVMAQISGGSINYTWIIPNNGETSELDGSAEIDGSDLSIYNSLISGSDLGVLMGAAAEINETSPLSGSVNGGCTVEVELLSSGDSGSNPRPGYGVVFWIDSTSTGEAALYGGEGSGELAGFPAGSRYDVTDSISEGGKARVWLKVNSAGTIKVNVKVPQTSKSLNKCLNAVPESGNLEIDLIASP